jgi:uncharacterized membrane protein YphA (DoxX/SURF4 family)
MSRHEKIELAQTINYLIALVWLLNGLCCKVLNYVPRHEQIVAKILNASYSRELTVVIGLGELVMAIWILSGYKKFTCAWMQIGIVFTMNLLEWLFARDLLLIGNLNFLFGAVFLCIVYLNAFRLSNPKFSIRLILH